MIHVNGCVIPKHLAKKWGVSRDYGIQIVNQISFEWSIIKRRGSWKNAIEFAMQDIKWQTEGLDTVA